MGDGGTAAVVDPARAERAAARRAPVPLAALAWALALPVALVTVAAVILLGPPLGRLLPDAGAFTFFPFEPVRPEPTEQARYLLTLAAPVLLAALVALLARRRAALPSAPIVWAGRLGQVVALGVVAAATAAQYELAYNAPQSPYVDRVFLPGTLVVGALLGLGAALLAARVPARRRQAAPVDETRLRRTLVALAAVVLTAVWLLQAVNSDSTIRWAHSAVSYTVQFPLDETFAVLNGHTPLVDFTTQYGALLPFATALSLLVFGTTLLAFTLTLTAISAVALLAVFDVFRRVTRSAGAALLLYAPFLASALFTFDVMEPNRFSPATYVALFPLRYAGPMFLAWLTVRRLERDGRATVPLFAVAGLVVLNNVEFGIAALGATVAALLWTAPGGVRAWRSLLRPLALGLAAALGLVAALTLARAGALPDLGRLVEYSRMYAVGFGLIPMPGVLGLHLVLWITYAAAIAVGTVRAVGGAPDRVLTGMLVWSGIFGFGIGSYFVAESGTVQLKASFAAWALALLLLAVAAVQRLAARGAFRPRPAELAVLAGAGVLACSLAQTPAPWTQVERLGGQHRSPGSEQAVWFSAPEGLRRDFFASLAWGRDRFYVKEGAPVALLVTTGHRIADAAGVVNVTPYSGIDSLHTVERLATVVERLRRAGGNTIFMPSHDLQLFPLLERWGFEALGRDGLGPASAGRRLVEVPGGDRFVWTKWVDTRNLHPRALRGDRGRLAERF